MAFRNIMVESPARIAVRNDQLLVCTDTEHSVAIEDISALLLENRQITITTAALSRLGQCGCAVFTCDERHMPCAVLTPYMQHSRQLSVIRSQLAMSEPQKKRLWQAIVKAKIQNQARCLQMAGQEDSAETNTERGPPEGEKNTAKTGGVKASINLNFKKDIDEWDGKSAKTFTIGNTSKPLKSIGVKDRTIKWAGDSILHSLKHDGMSLEVEKEFLSFWKIL